MRKGHKWSPQEDLDERGLFRRPRKEMQDNNKTDPKRNKI
jgi:hypothetical protein